MPEPRVGRVQTVLGLVDPRDLGHTMMHEHLGRGEDVKDDGLPLYFTEPSDPAARRLSHAPVTLENLWWIRYNFRDNLDNNAGAPAEVWESEVAAYRRAGGGTLVEVSPEGVADAGRMKALSERTGVHVVLGTGWYVHEDHPPADRIETRSVRWLVDRMVADIVDGDDETGVRCGLIGELGCSWPLHPAEEKVLRAAAVAQQETGVCISIHPARNDASVLQVRDVLAAAGADLSRVVMGHMDRCGYSLDARRDLADSGVTLEYDLFGMEGHYPAAAALADGVLPAMPNDVGRIAEIKELVDLGHRDQLVVGHDIHMKIQLTAYGGWGYGHYLRNVVPLMDVWGLDHEDVQRFSTANPHRLLAIA